LVQIVFVLTCPKQDKGKHPWSVFRITISAVSGGEGANQVLTSLLHKEKETAAIQCGGSCSSLALCTGGARMK